MFNFSVVWHVVVKERFFYLNRFANQEIFLHIYIVCLLSETGTFGNYLFGIDLPASRNSAINPDCLLTPRRRNVHLNKHWFYVSY